MGEQTQATGKIKRTAASRRSSWHCIFTRASPSLAVANRWGGSSSLLPLIVPVDAAVAAGAGGAAATAAVVEAGIAVDTAHAVAGADDACLLNLHYPQGGLLVCLLVHCRCCFVVAALKIARKFIQKIIRTAGMA